MELRKSDFYYDLPEELIAQDPLAKRSSSRLLVLDKNNELNDMALYALGLESKEEISEIMSAAINGNSTVEFKQQKWSYEDKGEAVF